MTVSQSATRPERSLARDVFYAVRYYLGNRWVLSAFAGLAVIAGLAFGGWGWLVAAGLAPIILSTLPCLLMCVFGVCMACRSGKTQSTAVREAADATTSSTMLGVARVDQSTADSSSCRHSGVDESHLPQTKQVHEVDEIKQVHVVDKRSDSHA